MKKAPFNISIESDYKELWRYNLALIGEVAVAGERVDVVRHLDEVASVGDNLKVAPQGYNPNRNVEIESADGESLTLYIYVVAHTIPTEVREGEELSFELRVRISHGGDMIYNRRHSVSTLSGENIEIHIDSGEVKIRKFGRLQKIEAE